MDGEKVDVCDPSGLFKGHFSLNQEALGGLLRPMMREFVHETRFNERLSSIENAVQQLQVQIEQRADAGHVHDLSIEVQETKDALRSKADLRMMNELRDLFPEWQMPLRDWSVPLTRVECRRGVWKKRMRWATELAST